MDLQLIYDSLTETNFLITLISCCTLSIILSIISNITISFIFKKYINNNNNNHNINIIINKLDVIENIIYILFIGIFMGLLSTLILIYFDINLW